MPLFSKPFYELSPVLLQPFENCVTTSTCSIQAVEQKYIVTFCSHTLMIDLMFYLLFDRYEQVRMLSPTAPRPYSLLVMVSSIILSTIRPAALPSVHNFRYLEVI